MIERTKDYIRTVKTWFVLFVAALILVAAAGGIWGSTGQIPVTDTVYGYVNENNEVLCLMDASRYSGSLLTGNDAVIRMVDGTITHSVVEDSTDFPITAEEFELASLVPDWMLAELINGEYMYVITIDLNESLRAHKGEMVMVSIVVDQKKPFELL